MRCNRIHVKKLKDEEKECLNDKLGRLVENERLMKTFAGMSKSQTTSIY